jgi:hypothetical protein
MRHTGAFLVLCLAHPAYADEQIYDRDPGHPWNRVYRAIYHRTMPDGSLYERESLEPPISRRSKILTQGAWNQQALAALDEFLKTKADTLVKDPLKRAIMQRDLWTVVARTAETPYLWPAQPKRRELQRRLVQVMSLIALAPDEFRQLPDNLTDAAAAGQFAKAYDPQHPDRAFLPPDLLRQDGAWVVLCFPFGSEHMAALQHTQAVNGASAFFVLLRLPTGRGETETYLKKLAEERSTPQIPKGTQVALLRRMMQVDRTGALRATPITESLQIRVYNDLNAPDMYEFTLKRGKLLSRRGGGLVSTGLDESTYFDLFQTIDYDPFETSVRPVPTVTLKSCIGCHGGPGVYGFQSVFQHRDVEGHLLAPHTLDGQTEAAVRKTHASYAWGLLQGMWPTVAGK